MMLPECSVEGCSESAPVKHQDKPYCVADYRVVSGWGPPVRWRMVNGLLRKAS